MHVQIRQFWYKRIFYTSDLFVSDDFLMHIYLQLVRKDMDVNEHERLSNIILFYCYI
jgi:hypothetical protein